MYQSKGFRLAISAALCLCGLVLYGQGVTLTNLSPPVGPLTPQTLTMVMVTNTSVTLVTGYMEAELLDGNLNSVATLRSVRLTLQSGEQRSYTSIPWSKQVAYGSSDAASRLRSSGLLSMGEYLLCHTFVDNVGVELGRECIEKKAELNLNFSLVYPRNESVLEQLQPTLVWEGVAQFGLQSGDITYELKLVELNQGQSPAEAIERNVALLHQRNLRATSFLYPQSVRPLKLDHTYAWMVKVFQGRDEVLVSEVWRFSLGEGRELLVEEEIPSYVMPGSEVDSRIYRFGSAIHLGFDNNEGIKELDYTIEEVSKDARKVSGLPTVDGLRSGLNTLTIPTVGMGLREGELYRLTIHTPQKRSYFLQFRFAAK